MRKLMVKAAAFLLAFMIAFPNPIAGLAAERPADKWDYEFLGNSVSLDGSIVLHFFFTFSEEIQADQNARLVLAKGENILADTALQDAVLKTGNGYVFSAPVRANDMGDRITATLYANNESRLVGESSVYDYLQRLRGVTKDVAVLKVADAMARYGRYAHYYEYGTEKPDAMDDATVAAVTEKELASYQEVITVDGEQSIYPYGKSLFTDYYTTMRLYYDIADVAGCRATINGAEAPISYSQSQKLYYVDVTKISAQSMVDDVVVTVSDANGSVTTVTSVYNYLNLAITLQKSEALTNLTKAMYLYSLSCAELVAAGDAEPNGPMEPVVDEPETEEPEEDPSDTTEEPGENPEEDPSDVPGGPADDSENPAPEEIVIPEDADAPKNATEAFTAPAPSVQSYRTGEEKGVTSLLAFRLKTDISTEAAEYYMVVKFDRPITPEDGWNYSDVTVLGQYMVLRMKPWQTDVGIMVIADEEVTVLSTYFTHGVPEY